MGTSNNNNVVTFRLRPAAMWVIQEQLKDNETINQFCQRVIHNHLGINNDNSDLKPREFEAIVADIIDESVSPLINYLQDRVNVLDDELKTLKTSVFNK